MTKIKTEQVEQLIQIIHEQNAWYIGAIAVVVAVMTIFLTFYSFQQKKISDEQVKKFNAEITRAKEISADLKDSNESIIQYSLAIMDRENRWVTTDWDQREKLYFTAKTMYKNYYSDNKELGSSLKGAAYNVVAASKQAFEVLLEKDGKTDINDSTDDGKKWRSKLNSAYVNEKSDKGIFYDELGEFNYSILKGIGHELNHSNIQIEWFDLLKKVNDFWDNEVLD